MNKESFKEIILEILRSDSDDVFNSFLKKVSEFLSGNKTLKLSGIGHFQVKREPLSRMERRGDESEKEILIFLSEGEISEEKILSFEIEGKSNISDNLTDSVFNIGINRPTVISESNEFDSQSESRILEFIESGDLLENFDLLNNVDFLSIKAESDEPPSERNEIEFNTKDIFIGEEFDSLESGDLVTEVKINKDFILDDSEFDDEGLDLNSDGLDGLDDETNQNIDEILHDEIDTNEFEIIGSKQENKMNEVNPFDELENYIKEDNIDEAQSILDETPEEIIEENPIQEKKDKKTTKPIAKLKKRESYSDARKKSNGFFKNPILYIALVIAIVAVVVVFFVLPKSETLFNETSETIELNKPGNIDSSMTDSSNSNSKIDSAVKAIENIPQKEPTAAEKMAEIRRLESEENKSTKNETIPETKKEIPQEVKKEIKKDEKEHVKKETKQTGKELNKTETTVKSLFREIPNDKTVTDRIYFDGRKYTVQISSWKSATTAEKEASKLKKRGFEAFVVKVFVPAKGSTWNRVRIGYFNSVKEAEEFLKKNTF